MAAGENPLRGILDPVARKLHLAFGTKELIDKIFHGGVNQALVDAVAPTLQRYLVGEIT